MVVRGGFNSLRAGRRIQRTLWRRATRVLVLVSIPYEREGVSKDFILVLEDCTQTSFNSLRAGRCIQSLYTADWTSPEIGWFQFPTNGKAYPKFLGTVRTQRRRKSFNSLRAGRCIQSLRVITTLSPRTPLSFQFPTNGKVYPKNGH